MKVNITIEEKGKDGSELRIMSFKAGNIKSDRQLIDFAKRSIDQAIESFKA